MKKFQGNEERLRIIEKTSIWKGEATRKEERPGEKVRGGEIL
jgi:hypothetical protein